MQNQKTNSEDIDIFVLGQKISHIFLRLLLLLFVFVKRLINGWKIILILALIGGVLGYITNKYFYTPAQEANLLVKINFDAGKYVYESVDFINKQVGSKNKLFFSEKLNFAENESVGKINITPVVNIQDIIKKSSQNTAQMTAMLKNLDYQFDNDLLKDALNYEYNYHFMDFSISKDSDIKIIEKLLDYFNSNLFFEKLAEANNSRIINTIDANEKTVEQVNDLIKKILDNKDSSSGQLYIDNTEFDLNDILKTKISLEVQNESLRKERLLSSETVMLINNENISLTKVIGIPMYSFIFIVGYVILLALSSIVKYFNKFAGSINSKN